MFKLRNIISIFIMICMLGLISCGTILYPDRKGHKGGGNLDPAVVVLDSIGFLFFIIPGVIAFAVDFSTGAIYYPNGKKQSSTLEPYNIKTFNQETVAMIQQEYFLNISNL